MSQPGPPDGVASAVVDGRVVVGRVDEPEAGAEVPVGPVRVRGWSVVDGRPAVAVAVSVDDRIVGQGVVGNDPRPDVAESLGDRTLASAGWALTADLSGIEAGRAVEVAVSVWTSIGGPTVELGRRPVTTVEAEDPEAAADAALAPEVAAHGRALAELAAHVEVVTVGRWIDAAEVEEGPLVTVTVATRDRPALLRQAVRSALAQTYRNVEVVVVDDSSTPGAAASALAGIDDPRLRVVANARRGAAAAFNTGLDHATGDLIAFLDDDNLLHPGWARAVAWAFATYPGVDSLYGARVCEPHGGTEGPSDAVAPRLDFAPYDRHRHEQGNYIDRGVVALRSRLRHVRHDESLPGVIDWDYQLRLFALAPPLPLPVVACHYRSSAPGRISEAPATAEARRVVRARAHTTRALRVHCHEDMYPVSSETYIYEDIESLRAAGALVTISSVAPATSTIEGVERPPIGLRSTAEGARPDIVLIHWTTTALASLPDLEAMELPFACIVHSFERDGAAEVAAHPLCAALFSHPHTLGDMPPGTVGHVPVIGPWTEVPPPSAKRPVVLSSGAGLPKRDWEALFEGLAGLGEMERHVAIAPTNGGERYAAELAARAAEVDPAIEVTVDMPRSQLLALTARSTAVVYPIRPDAGVGWPMSIAEAMRCGALVVAPDRPELRHVVGSGLRPYRTPGDIVDQVRLVAAGGPEVDRCRREVMERSAAWSSPRALRSLHDALRDRLTAWRYARG